MIRVAWTSLMSTACRSIGAVARAPHCTVALG